MKLKDFSYSLPEGLIAAFPLEQRDKARLLVVDRATKTFAHDTFANIGRYLPPKSVLVVNDSKVVHARLLGRRKTGGEVEIFLLKEKEKGIYEALLRPLKRLKVNEEIVFDDGGLVATIVDTRNRLVRFNKKDLKPHLEKFGHIPLPPYIRRADTPADKEFYQTVYARKEGSVAAPTAGLHFTKRLIGRLEKGGHRFAQVTLHINYGTFKPVEEEDITRHRMHEEEYSVTRRTCDALQKSKSRGQRIVAVGTTSCRVLETMAGNKRLNGSTDKFIYPGYQFRMTDILLTNFHLPYSTLLMLVCAFGGHELIMRAYREAIEQKYRFYSYGDAMLII